MEHFNQGTKEKRVRGGRPFSVIHQFIQGRGKNSRKAGAEGTGKRRERTDSGMDIIADCPVHTGDEPCDSTDQSGNDTADRTKKQAGRQGSDITHIQ